MSRIGSGKHTDYGEGKKTTLKSLFSRDPDLSAEKIKKIWIDQQSSDQAAAKTIWNFDDDGYLTYKKAPDFPDSNKEIKGFSESVGFKSAPHGIYIPDLRSPGIANGIDLGSTDTESIKVNVNKDVERAVDNDGKEVYPADLIKSLLPDQLPPDPKRSSTRIAGVGVGSEIEFGFGIKEVIPDQNIKDKK